MRTISAVVGNRQADTNIILMSKFARNAKLVDVLHTLSFSCHLTPIFLNFFFWWWWGGLLPFLLMVVMVLFFIYLLFWRLFNLDNYGDGLWANFYLNDPFAKAPHATPDQLDLIQGGETTMWGECVDAVIFDAIVWPRAAAAAEQLWSPSGKTKSASNDVAVRLAEHRCRLVRRGVMAAPLNDMDTPRALNPGCQ